MGGASRAQLTAPIPGVEGARPVSNNGQDRVRLVVGLAVMLAGFWIGVSMPPALPRPHTGPVSTAPEPAAAPLPLGEFAPTENEGEAAAVLRLPISAFCVAQGNSLPMGCRLLSGARACAQMKCQAGLDGPLSQAAQSWRHASCDLLPAECGGEGGGGGVDPPPPPPVPECRWYDLICHVRNLF